MIPPLHIYTFYFAIVERPLEWAYASILLHHEILHLHSELHFSLPRLKGSNVTLELIALILSNSCLAHNFSESFPLLQYICESFCSWNHLDLPRLHFSRLLWVSGCKVLCLSLPHVSTAKSQSSEVYKWCHVSPSLLCTFHRFKCRGWRVGMDPRLRFSILIRMLACKAYVKTFHVKESGSQRVITCRYMLSLMHPFAEMPELLMVGLKPSNDSS